MFGQQKGPQKTQAPQAPENGKPAAPMTLLTVVGDHARVEGKFEIAETGRVSGNIQTDSLVISKGGFFNGNVTKMNEEPSAQRPVYLIDEKRVGQQQTAQR